MCGPGSACLPPPLLPSRWKHADFCWIPRFSLLATHLCTLNTVWHVTVLYLYHSYKTPRYIGMYRHNLSNWHLSNHCWPWRKYWTIICALQYSHWQLYQSHYCAYRVKLNHYYAEGEYRVPACFSTTTNRPDGFSGDTVLYYLQGLWFFSHNNHQFFCIFYITEWQ